MRRFLGSGATSFAAAVIAAVSPLFLYLSARALQPAFLCFARFSARFHFSFFFYIFGVYLCSMELLPPLVSSKFDFVALILSAWFLLIFVVVSSRQNCCHYHQNLTLCFLFHFESCNVLLMLLCMISPRCPRAVLLFRHRFNYSSSCLGSLLRCISSFCSLLFRCRFY